ncbi:MAG: hypothetical protein LBC53_01570 [Spirochaetaceae bacterium]|jgi:hypothetical protein|nr:hypothetical protein [Spirochaetaceae bacterium]
MEIINKPEISVLVFGLLAFVFTSSCAVKNKDAVCVLQNEDAAKAQNLNFKPENYGERERAALDAISEFERSNGFLPGMGLAESTLRENAGDYSGAVTAAFKELQWAYSYGGLAGDGKADKKPMEKKAVKDGLQKIKTLYLDKEKAPDVSMENKMRAILICNALLDFTDGRYEKTLSSLKEMSLDTDDEPDDFLHWVRLVCEGEINISDADSRRARYRNAEYAAIRARYSSFPPYWYFGARHTTGAVSAEFAERCIDLFPEGPYAKEARYILASYSGLNLSEGPVFLTKKEIEQTVMEAVNNGDPSLLTPLLPLAGLPDNYWTAYATGAMRGVAELEPFKEWFLTQQEKIKNSKRESRLFERLNYIVRG